MIKLYTVDSDLIEFESLDVLLEVSMKAVALGWIIIGHTIA